MNQYPSCVVNLLVRLEPELVGVADTSSPVSDDEAVARPATRPGTPTPIPLILRPVDRNDIVAVGIVPKKAHVDLREHRKAATYEVVLDFKQLPIDPRTVRAASVEVHHGTIHPYSFARGVTGHRHEDGSSPSVLTSRDVDGSMRSDTLGILGPIDEWEINYTTRGIEVTLRGRDLRGMLIDSPLVGLKEDAPQILDSLDMSLPLDNVLKQILAHHPYAAAIRVLCLEADFPGGVIPGAIVDTNAPRHRRGARWRPSSSFPQGRPNARRGPRHTGKSANNQMSYWDLITQVCNLVGAIPYFVGPTLCVRPARTVFDQVDGDDRGLPVPTPFRHGRPRTDPATGEQFRVRRLVYGRDIETLRMTRRYASDQRPHTIQCVAYDTSSAGRGIEKVLIARWPPEDAPADQRATSSAPNASQSREEMLTVPVYGVRSQEQLLEIARNLWSEIGSREIHGSAGTRNVASQGGDNEDPDLLRLRPGDAIEFYADRRPSTPAAPLANSAADFYRGSPEEVIRDVAARLGSEPAARAIVLSARGMVERLVPFFRVMNVRIEWSAQSGFTLQFDFQNYFVLRAQDNGVVQPNAQATRRRGVGHRGPTVTMGEGRILVPTVTMGEGRILGHPSADTPSEVSVDLPRRLEVVPQRDLSADDAIGTWRNSPWRER